MGKPAPTFSIALPVFNESKYIEKTVISILSQTDPDFEIIIGDNASDDGTGEILSRLADSDNRIRLFRHEKNLGAVANFDFTETKASGRYLAWIGGHDLYAPHLLETIRKEFKEHPDASLVYPRCQLVNDESKPIGRGCSPIDSRALTRAEAMIQVVRNLRKCGNIYGFFPRDLIQKRPKELIYGADDLILFWVAGLGPIIEADIEGITRELPRLEESADDRFARYKKHGVIENDKPLTIPVQRRITGAAHLKWLWAHAHISLTDRLRVAHQVRFIYQQRYQAKVPSVRELKLEGVEEMKAILPNTFLVGCQKSGTTWLHRCLREHPEIYVPEEDEIHYFDIHYDEGPDYLNRYYGQWNGEAFSADTTSSYSRDPEVARRIHEHNPDAKIIITLRNPIDRAFSHYWHEKKKDKIAFSFEEWERNYDLYENWIATGFYTRQLERFAKFFPKDRILVLIQEEMLADPKSTLRILFEFIGASPGFQPSWLNKKVNVAPKVNPDQRPTEYGRGLDPKMRERLQRLYKPEIERLEKWIGRPMPTWNAIESETDAASQARNTDRKLSSRHVAYMHRVGNAISDFGVDAKMTVATEVFENWIREERTRRKFVSAKQFVDLLHDEDPELESSLLLTIDDGYIDTLDTVLPLLEKYEVPATVFVTTGFVDGSIVPYEWILSEHLKNCSEIAIDPNNPDQKTELSDETRPLFYEELRKAAKFENYEGRMAFLQFLGAQELIDSYTVESRFMSWDAVRKLAESPLITIGAHTVTHSPLNCLQPTKLMAELRDARVRLMNQLGIPIDYISYPYGAYDLNTILAARAAGYRAAFTTAPTASSSDPIALRMQIPRAELQT